MAELCILFLISLVLPSVIPLNEEYGIDKPHARRRETYLGKFIGPCEKSGFYYYDSESYLVCANGNAYRQPCAPGTRNSGYNKFSNGDDYKAHDFCDENLVSRGYDITFAKEFYDKHFPSSKEIITEEPSLDQRPKRVQRSKIIGKEFEEDIQGVTYFKGPRIPSPYLQGYNDLVESMKYDSPDIPEESPSHERKEITKRSRKIEFSVNSVYFTDETEKVKSQEELDYQRKYGLGDSTKLSKYNAVYRPPDMDHAFGYTSQLKKTSNFEPIGEYSDPLYDDSSNENFNDEYEDYYRQEQKYPQHVSKHGSSYGRNSDHRQASFDEDSEEFEDNADVSFDRPRFARSYSDRNTGRSSHRYDGNLSEKSLDRGRDNNYNTDEEADYKYDLSTFNNPDYNKNAYNDIDSEPPPYHGLLKTKDQEQSRASRGTRRNRKLMPKHFSTSYDNQAIMDSTLTDYSYKYSDSKRQRH